MTPQRQGKRVLRAIRNIPTYQIAPAVTASERRGMWCLVAGDLVFVLANGGTSVTCWDDPIEHAQFVRYVQAHPERIHATHATALEFVRSQLGVRQ